METARATYHGWKFVFCKLWFSGFSVAQQSAEDVDQSNFDSQVVHSVHFFNDQNVISVESDRVRQRQRQTNFWLNSPTCLITQFPHPEKSKIDSETQNPPSRLKPVFL